MTTEEMIALSLKNIEEQRKLQKENAGYNVQYCPCGHYREIGWNEFELVKKAKNNRYLDAIILPSSDCPFCKR